MSWRMKIASGLIGAGCALFFAYGATVAFLGEATAAYQFNRMSGSSFAALPEEARSFMGTLVILIGLLGAGLALCSGVLFTLGLAQRNRRYFLAALLGGALGVASLLTVHLDQRAWVLFILDNVCLNVLGAGIMAGGKELRDLMLGRSTSAPEMLDA